MWFMVGLWLAHCWVMVGTMLVIVGAMLGDSWRLVGFWLAVNVGPTFIQRAKLRWPNQICCCWANIKPTVGFWLANG